MSWNEPGGGKKDPWSGRGGDDKGPPDLDETIRALQEKIGRIFGGGGGGSSSGGSMKGFGFLVGGAVVLWGLSGFYIVDEGNHGVVTRFGKYTETSQAGLNWHIPAPIESVELVNVRRQRFIEVGYRSVGAQQTLGSVPKEALMLTKDENIVDVRLAVQYQVKDAKDFLFNVVSPEITLKQVTEAAQRGVVGSSKMDFVLTEGRTEIVAQIREEIQDVMDSYESGVQITSVNLQDAQPPEQVQGAFEDAIKAREDQQRLINEAEAYSNDVIPKARGAAARKLQEAEGYKQQVIARAEGETSRFLALLGEYKKAPEVTRERLYIESVQSVLTHSNTVFLDVKSANNLLYLPLDKLIRQSPTDESAQIPQAGSVTQTRPIDPVFRTTTRGREGRGR